MDFLNLTPLALLQKTHFWSTLWLKVDLSADLGGALHPSHPPGYGPASHILHHCTILLNGIHEIEIKQCNFAKL